ncbi:MAG: hypothetical protein JSS75_00930 [Bacteroidetes bacterium]|nr:hypothetical protein [Bacteroidota bacterium]
MIFCLLLVLLPISVGNALAQWTRCNGPYACRVNAVTTIGATLIAATDRDVWWSRDSGNTWSEGGCINIYAPSLTPYVIRFVATAKGFVFAVTDSSYCYRSADSGKVWKRMDGSGLGSVTSVLSVDSVVLAVDDGILKRTTDYGQSWSTVLPALKIRNYTSPVVSKNTLYLLLDSGMAISTDAGDHWSMRSFVWPPEVHLFDELEGMWFVECGTQGMFVSRDSGQHWVKSLAGLEELHATTLATTDAGIYAGTLQDGLFLSTDLGVTWRGSDPSIPDGHITCTRAFGDGVLVGTDVALFFRRIQDSIWKQCTIPALPVTVVDLGTYRGQLVAGSYSGLFFSSDGGTTWHVANARTGVGYTNDMVGGIVIEADTVWVGSDGGSVCRSSDGGLSWNCYRVEMVTTPIFHLWAHDRVFLASSYYETYRSQNGGITWTFLNPPDQRHALDFFSGVDSVVYGWANLILYRSSDLAKHWQPAQFPQPSGTPRQICSADSSFFFTADSGLFRSTDLGENWDKIGFGLPAGSFRMISSDSRRYLTTLSQGAFFISSDQGSSWQKTVSAPARESKFATWFFLDTILYVSQSIDGAFETSAGLWKRSFTELLARSPDYARSLECEISPNPYEVGATPLHLKIRNYGATQPTLMLVDMLGRTWAVRSDAISMHSGADMDVRLPSLAPGPYVLQVVSEGAISSSLLVIR